MAKVTLIDIAEACGVSKGLVSRALNGKYNVSDEVRAKINQKAVELGYDFENLHTKGRQEERVALVASSRILLKEDFWQPIIKTITATLDRSSIRLEYLIFDEERIDDEFIRKLALSPAKAFVVMHSNPEILYEAMKKLGKPIVEVDPKLIHFDGVTQIKFSNYDSMYMATQALINKGHTKIAFYGSDMHATSFRERHEGFLSCIDKNKKNVKGISIIFDNSSLQYGDNELFKKALEEHRFTGLVCANDIVALNAYRMIEREGLRIPQDISVVGFDNVMLGASAVPPLSTFNVPREELGREVGKYLVNLFAERQLPYSQIVIRCGFLERGSIAERK